MNSGPSQPGALDPDLAEWISGLLTGTGLTPADALELAAGAPSPVGLERVAAALADGWANGQPLEFAQHAAQLGETS